MESKVLQDISRYQQSIDFKLLKSKGQDKIIIKAGSGNLSKDVKFEEHYAKAKAEGFQVSVYVWHDPIYDPIAQAKFFIELTKGKDIAFICIDLEEWWADWNKWTQYMTGQISQASVPIVSPDNLLNHFKKVYDYLATNSGYQIVIYTARWFLDAYCPKAYDYLKDKFTHWAEYSVYVVKGKKTWEEIESISPTGKPYFKPTYPTNKALIWQWSGDKITADGVYANTAKTVLSALDTNVWISTDYTWESISASSGSIVTEPIPQPLNEIAPIKSTRFLTVLNVPYASQLGTGASQHANDCGAACGVMVLEAYMGEKMTVDQFFNETGVTFDAYLNADQIINVLSKHHLGARWFNSDMKTLMDNLRAGRPTICLLNYSTLRRYIKTETQYDGNQFVVAVAYDTKNIYVHDPLWVGQGGKEIEVPYDGFENAWKDAGIDPSVAPAYGCIVPNTTVAPTLQKWQVTASVLNVRSGPSTAYPIVGSMVHDQIFYVESITNGWGKIPDVGYCNLGYCIQV
jgi:hypothetical protein